MKSKIGIFVLALSIISLFMLSTCKKDKSMDALIVVKMHLDTNVVVANAEVRISVPINSTAGQDIDDIIGYTDYKGEFRQTFDLPVQLNIRVEKDSLSGIGVLNMNRPGMEVTKRVYIY